MFTCNDGRQGHQINSVIILARDSLPMEEHGRLYEAITMINPDYFEDVMDSAIESANADRSLVLNYFARYSEKVRYLDGRIYDHSSRIALTNKIAGEEKHARRHKPRRHARKRQPTARA